MSVPQSGRRCQSWALNQPHQTRVRPAVYNHNFCSNPDRDPRGAWCYTTDPNVPWDFCDIPRCRVDNFNEETEQFARMRGVLPIVTEESNQCWSKWAKWSSCTKSCGGGVRIRSRTCKDPECCGNAPDRETGTCGSDPCYNLLSWSEWSNCPVTCLSGRRKPEVYRTQRCANLGDTFDETDFEQLELSRTPRGAERACNGTNAVEKKPCEVPSCPAWAGWGEWSQCQNLEGKPVSCGTGWERRSRNCERDGEIVTGCVGVRNERQLCNTHVCTSWTSWTIWSECSVSCGIGRLKRSRYCQQENNQKTDFRRREDAVSACKGPNINFRQVDVYTTRPEIVTRAEQVEQTYCNKECNSTHPFDKVQPKDPMYLIFDGNFTSEISNVRYNGIYRKIDAAKLARLLLNTAGRSVYKYACHLKKFNQKFILEKLLAQRHIFTSTDCEKSGQFG